tara:strand:- start:177 stop:353 length:177 start_codon:yes stop_codon:yes gene_type:complete
MAAALGNVFLFGFTLQQFAKKSFFSSLQHLAMDVSASISMKDAAKCDKHCEWQNSANQ